MEIVFMTTRNPYVCISALKFKIIKLISNFWAALWPWCFMVCFFFSCFFYYRSNLKDIFPFSDNLVRLVNNLMFRISMQIEFTINKSRCQADGKILASSAWQQNCVPKPRMVIADGWVAQVQNCTYGASCPEAKWSPMVWRVSTIALCRAKDNLQ